VVLAAGFAAAAVERHTEFVRYRGVQIEVVVDGEGPAVVLLPSLARDSDDYDQVAEGLAASGFRVLRPKPRGIGRSAGPLTNITLHDLALDIAEVIEKFGNGRAVIVGHAYGNWVARMTAADHPKLVRGVVIAAAAAKQYAPELTTAVTNAGDLTLSNEERLAALRFAFFAPGNDPAVWLHGWHPDIRNSQRAAVAAVRQDEWWSGGTAPLLDLQAAQDPFKPESKRNEMKDEFGDRVTVMVIPNASHALIPEQPKAVVEALTTWIKGLP
jgi:pimeloyl-ACP methyl ester carboxylesterase